MPKITRGAIYHAISRFFGVTLSPQHKSQLLKVIPQSVRTPDGKIAEPFVPHLALEIVKIFPGTGKTAEELVKELRNNDFVAQIDFKNLYQMLLNEGKVVLSAVKQRDLNARLLALQELIHDLGVNPEENRKIATRCLREALGYSGVRVYTLDLERGTWLHRFAEGEEGISRFVSPKVPAENSEKAFLSKLLQGEVSLEEIAQARAQGTYEWYQNGEWSYLYIPDRTRCPFVEYEQLVRDEKGDVKQERNGYGEGVAREILYLVFGKKGDKRVDVYLVNNWKTKKPLFSEKEQDIKLLRTFASALAQARNLAYAYHKLQDESVHDELTGVHNRRYFNRKINNEFIRAQRSNYPLSLLMLDIDHFKSINDTYGHQVGDLVLRKVAEVIKAIVRDKIDTVARYGGEEFAVILPMVNGGKGANASEIAERIRSEVEKIKIETFDFGVTISIGLASFPKNASNLAELIYKADQALYRAKENGRNRVEISS